ncbi:MAG: hypothetical protein R3C00_02455 [Hyphomonas sp.]|nr:hypothetical protein [Hyphomonas sp.]MCB9971440.1 hypothetical protein [Hyphomonas sp.]
MITANGVALAFSAGFFFMLANLVMKYSHDLPLVISIGTVALLALVGIFIEIQALKSAEFGTTVVIIIAAEILFSSLAAYWLLSESYGARQIVGLLLVVVGIGILTTGPSPAGASDSQASPLPAIGRGL